MILEPITKLRGLTGRGYRYLGWAAAAALAVPAIFLGQQVGIAEYAVPTPQSGPWAIVAGPDGAAWFAESSGNKIGRITAAGGVTDYAVPTPNSGPDGITAGPDGALWFTESSANKIGRITTEGVVTEYAVPTANSAPYWITAGPDGALWFTEFSANQIGRITTAGAITEYPVPVSTSGAPEEITAGPDGALWFTRPDNTGSIDRITTAGVITEYPMPLGSPPYSITAGPDGALWFTQWSISQIGRITTSGSITGYPLPSAGSVPLGITQGPDGALWFTESGTNEIGRITTSGSITEFPIPVANSGLHSITAGSGQLWFTEVHSGQIGEAVVVTATLTVAPETGSYQTKLRFKGGSFAPNEGVTIYRSGIGSTALAKATTDALGSFTVNARAPASPYGPRLFLAVGQTSGDVGAASFSVAPRMVLNPTSGSLGSVVKAQGYGFGALERVRIRWNKPPTLLGVATANVRGEVKLRFKVPVGSFKGTKIVSAKGKTTGATASATFTVQ